METPTDLIPNDFLFPEESTFLFDDQLINAIDEDDLKIHSPPPHDVVVHSPLGPFSFLPDLDLKTTENFTLPENDTRFWKACGAYAGVYASQYLTGRREKERNTTTVDEKLYMSIRYDLTHVVRFRDPMMTNRLMVKTKMFFDDGRPARNSDGSIVSVEEGPLSSSKGFEFGGVSRLRFLDSSYHHNRRSFVLLTEYVDCTGRLVARFVSPKFKVYARKPQKKKRKRNNQSKDEGDQMRRVPKKRKIDHAVVPSESFAANWKSVEKGMMEMNDDERLLAFNMIIDKLLPALK